MEITERQKHIINLIAQSRTSITGTAIASSLLCSLRTVQNEISAINDMYDVIESTNKGYMIKESNYANLKEAFVEQKEEYDIIKAILFSSNGIHIDELCNTFYLSPSALDGAIRKQKTILEAVKLELNRHNSVLTIDGKEQRKRRLMSYLINSDIENNDIPVSEALFKVFPYLNIERLRGIIIQAIDKYDHYIEDIYLNTVIINITIALIRMREFKHIDVDYSGIISAGSPEHLISEFICNNYAQHFYIYDFTYSEEDIRYIATLLAGQIKPLNIVDSPDASMRVISRSFLEAIDEILAETFSVYNLNLNYEELVYNFALHVEGLISRSSNSIQAYNNMRDQLKTGSPFIHDVSVHISELLSKRFDITISESEICFISIHIGFLIEESMKSSKKVNVLLYSSEYRKLIEGIRDKLLRNFGNDITLNILNDLSDNPLLLDSSDMIITTKNTSILGKRVVHISPFYTSKDNLLVSDMIHEVQSKKENEQLNSLYSSYFSKELFFKTNEFKTQKEVIDFLCAKLDEKSIIAPDFKENVFKREELSSTCFSNMFAIPHSLLLNSYETRCCVLISDESIQWGDNSVQVVMMIAVKSGDQENFMRIYEKIAHHLMDEHIIHKVIQSNDFNQFINLIKG